MRQLCTFGIGNGEPLGITPGTSFGATFEVFIDTGGGDNDMFEKIMSRRDGKTTAPF
jgi:hypothetical protein